MNRKRQYSVIGISTAEKAVFLYTIYHNITSIGVGIYSGLLRNLADAIYPAYIKRVLTK